MPYRGQNPMISGGAESPQIWAIASGKGGVGKTFLSSNLAISLAHRGQRVIAIDLDLGGSNLHTTLGVRLPEMTLANFLNHGVRQIQQCVVDTPTKNLKLIAGPQSSAESYELNAETRLELTRQFRNLPCDVVILDLGAGTFANSTEFFIYSDLGVIILLPEPTSIENAYRFLKSTYYDIIKKNTHSPQIHKWVDMASGQRASRIITSPADLFKAIKSFNIEEYHRIRYAIGSYRPKIVVNQTRTQSDVEIGQSIVSVCKKYFGIDSNYVGHIDYESAVWQAVRRRKPVIIEFPGISIVQQIESVTQNLKQFSLDRTLFL